jgi:hypothetical protein
VGSVTGGSVDGGADGGGVVFVVVLVPGAIVPGGAVPGAVVEVSSDAAANSIDRRSSAAFPSSSVTVNATSNEVTAES